VRDLLLTLAAWGLLFYLMSDTLRLAHDYLRPPRFEFSSMEPPNWRELWERLRPFFGFVAVLVLWLLFWALVRGRRMRATAPVPQPAPLALAVHAAGFGLEEATLAPWREARCLVVHFSAAGQVSHGEAKPLD
jgi:cytochrome bd-type quinol oxidase subunit 2